MEIHNNDVGLYKSYILRRLEDETISVFDLEEAFKEGVGAMYDIHKKFGIRDMCDDQAEKEVLQAIEELKNEGLLSVDYSSNDKNKARTRDKVGKCCGNHLRLVKG